MQNILKKYYELDEESKEILPFLYMYQELLSTKDDYENIKIDNMYDEEILMQTIIKCWYYTNLDATNIVDKLLSILNCQDITISDLKDLNIDELQELVCDETLNETQAKESDIISEFICKGFYCIFCKSNEKYLLILTKDEKTEVIVFNQFEDIFSAVITNHILEKFLYGKP